MATNPARAAAALAAVAVALGMSACGAAPAREEVPAPGPTAPVSTGAPSGVPETPGPAAEPDAAPTPGALCDPADGDPDCTDSTTDGAFRHVEGFADCVAEFGEDEADGLCTDLDGDGVRGYPDSH